MRVLIGLGLIVAVCLFIYLIGKKGKVKDVSCDSCINCPMNCGHRDNATKE